MSDDGDGRIVDFLFFASQLHIIDFNVRQSYIIQCLFGQMILLMMRR